MGLAKTEEEWGIRATAFLKAKMKESEVTYSELVKRLKKHGFKETKASIANKLARGTHPTAFFLAALASIGALTIDLEAI